MNDEAVYRTAPATPGLLKKLYERRGKIIERDGKNTNCCPKDSPLGLTVGCPRALEPKEGDYFALLAWKKWKVNTFPH